MDEVFDLKQKNMWFRSRLVWILKQFLRAFMGDSVNRYVSEHHVRIQRANVAFVLLDVSP
jgi:hypothetical protein